MKLTSLCVATLCALVMTTQIAFARSVDGFTKRFQIIRADNGKLIGVRDRTMPVKFSIAPYVSMIKEQLIAEQSLMAKNLRDGSYETSIREMLEEDRALFLANGNSNEEFNQYVNTVVDSLKKLAVVNVESIFSNAVFNEVVSKYEGKLTDAILMLDPTVLANVQDPTFFYKRNVTYKAVSWALDFARKRLSQVPALNTASYVIVQVEKLITERRNFHQNMLMHYLENFKEEDLGLTHEEVNMIWSSVYESRIPWFAFWESNNAKNNWLKYGVNNFYAGFRGATAKLNQSISLYSEVNERVNFAFQRVRYNNENVIINLFDSESMLQNRPAVAFNYDKPTQIARKRVMLTLAQLGLSFVPVNATIKDTVSSFIKSYYEKQRLTEGALYGFFESQGDKKGMTDIKAQYLNPFDALHLQ